MKRGMHSEQVTAIAGAVAGIMRGAGAVEQAEAHGHYTVECYGADGKLKWADTIENLVTTGGKNDALDKYLSGSTYTAAWYLGLIDSAGYGVGPAAADTMASHAGWAECQSYTQGARPTASFAAAAGGSKALSAAAVYSINANVTIKGCFLGSVSTKGGTTGILYSAGTFAAGDKVMQAGDTLNVTYTASL